MKDKQSSKTTVKPEPETDAALLAWFERFNSSLDAWEVPSAWMTGPPPGPVSADTLAQLLHIRQRLAVRDRDPAPARQAAERFAASFANASRGDTLLDLVMMLAVRLDALIGDMLDKGHRADSIIATKDFSEWRPMCLRGAEILASGGVGDVILICGLIRSLPEGHRLRTILPAGEFYLADGQNEFTASLVLGRAVGNGIPRAFYPTADAIQFTQLYRGRQLERDRQQAEADAREARERDRSFWDSEIGQLEQKRQLLDKLKQAGKLPAEPKLEPAIRQGRN